jgi:hypothetical protein
MSANRFEVPLIRLRHLLPEYREKDVWHRLVIA